ncbi:MAG: NHL repeat-containing protein, partial [Pseudolabrys sp.]
LYVSALPPKADIGTQPRHVRFVPAPQQNELLFNSVISSDENRRLASMWYSLHYARREAGQPSQPVPKLRQRSVDMGGSHQLQVIVTGLSVPVGLAFEAGDLYIVNTNTSPPTAINNTVSVFPERNGTLFGVPVTRHVLTTVFSGLSAPTGLAFDDRGNLYVANAQNGTVSVLPKASGTLFGVAVIENKPATVVSALSTPQRLAFDQAGNLYITSFLNNTVSVLPKASGTLFGMSVTANTLATLVSGLDRPAGLGLDQAGNLYIANFTAATGPNVNGTISVLPKASGTLFGVPVTQNKLATLVSGLDRPQSLAFDDAGNLYMPVLTGPIANPNQTVSVLPKARGTLFGVPVTANTLATVASDPDGPVDVAFDNAGNLYIANLNNGTVSILKRH